MGKGTPGAVVKTSMTESLTPDIRDLTIGLQLQKAGRLAEAARCYRSVLDRQPDNADALHLLGVLLYQNGRLNEAIRMIGRAVAVRPGEAAYHANLALAFRAGVNSSRPSPVAGPRCGCSRTMPPRPTTWGWRFMTWGDLPRQLRSSTPPWR